MTRRADALRRILARRGSMRPPRLVFFRANAGTDLTDEEAAKLRAAFKHASKTQQARWL